MSGTTPRDVGLAIVLLTVCVMAGGVVFLPALGYPVDASTVTAVFGLFSAMAAAAVTWIARSQIEVARTDTVRAEARAEATQEANAQMAVRMAELQARPTVTMATSNE